MSTNAAKAAHAPFRPLDPLSPDEMQLARDLVTAAEQLEAQVRFPMVELHEPPKAEVVAFNTGDKIFAVSLSLQLNSNQESFHGNQKLRTA